MDSLIEEFKEYRISQNLQCTEHHRVNNDEHEKIWIVIDDIREWTWKTKGAIVVLAVFLPVVSAVVSSIVIKVLGI